MNQSQRILREVSNDPTKSIAFLKKLNWLIAVTSHNIFLIVVGYMLGISTGLAIYIWLIKQEKA